MNPLTLKEEMELSLSDFIKKRKPKERPRTLVWRDEKIEREIQKRNEEPSKVIHT